MSESDAAYYRRRAQAEVDCANRAADPQSARIHEQLAEAYRQRAAATPDDRPRHA